MLVRVRLDVCLFETQIGRRRTLIKQADSIESCKKRPTRNWISAQPPARFHLRARHSTTICSPAAEGEGQNLITPPKRRLPLILFERVKKNVYNISRVSKGGGGGFLSRRLPRS